jgi:hypothetical protein
MLLIFSLHKFLKIEDEDNEARNQYSNKGVEVPNASVVRHALLLSLVFVLISGLIGFISGFIAKIVFGTATGATIKILQVCGALILLWATLFVRGWEIQTYAGVTFSERVNQWVYRALYCVGTAIILFSLAWT